MNKSVSRPRASFVGTAGFFVYVKCVIVNQRIGGDAFEVGPGQAACVPRGAVHSFRNRTAQNVKMLCIITPAAIGPEYFREIGAVLKARSAARPTAQRWLKSCTAMD